MYNVHVYTPYEQFAHRFCLLLPYFVVVIVVVLKVISTLKQITIQESIVGEEEEEEGEHERAVTSLDRPHDRNSSSPR